jgi:hypothetical protein
MYNVHRQLHCSNNAFATHDMNLIVDLVGSGFGRAVESRTTVRVHPDVSAHFPSPT